MPNKPQAEVGIVIGGQGPAVGSGFQGGPATEGALQQIRPWGIMRSRGSIHNAEQTIAFLSRTLNNIGVYVLVLMMLLTVAYVFLRHFLSKSTLIALK